MTTKNAMNDDHWTSNDDQIKALKDCVNDLLAALEDARNALALIDDFGTASQGMHPDIQNRALDKASAAIARAKGETDG